MGMGISGIGGMGPAAAPAMTANIGSATSGAKAGGTNSATTVSGTHFGQPKQFAAYMDKLLNNPAATISELNKLGKLGQALLEALLEALLDKKKDSPDAVSGLAGAALAALLMNKQNNVQFVGQGAIVDGSASSTKVAAYTTAAVNGAGSIQSMGGAVNTTS